MASSRYIRTMKRAQKRSARKKFRALVLFLALTCPSLLGSPAHALPQQGTVVGGQATINTSGPNMNINQSSDRAIINWQSFNIGKSESVQHNMPQPGSAALHRVTGAGASQLEGMLRSNGQIYLVNPNGIVIHQGARIETGGFTATTADIKNSDFMNGDMRFNIPGRPDASVINLGHITVKDAGIAALVAPTVRNEGVIAGKLAKVALASGQTFALDMHGDELIRFTVPENTAGDLYTTQGVKVSAENSGKILAEGGVVLMTASQLDGIVSATVNNSGIISADSVEMKGGKIILKAEGDNASVTNTGALSASSTQGDGGTVRLVADKDANVSGSITATGARKGGHVDISGKQSTTLTAATVKAGGATQGLARVGGEFQGGADKGGVSAAQKTGFVLRYENLPALFSTKLLTVDAQSSIDAGSDGTVVLWSDASGIVLAGPRGRYLEVSAKNLNYSFTHELMPQGHFLLDPDVIRFVGTGGANNGDGLNGGTHGYGNVDSSGLTSGVLEISSSWLSDELDRAILNNSTYSFLAKTIEFSSTIGTTKNAADWTKSLAIFSAEELVFKNDLTFSTSGIVEFDAKNSILIEGGAYIKNNKSVMQAKDITLQSGARIDDANTTMNATSVRIAQGSEVLGNLSINYPAYWGEASTPTYLADISGNFGNVTIADASNVKVGGNFTSLNIFAQKQTATVSGVEVTRGTLTELDGIVANGITINADNVTVKGNVFSNSNINIIGSTLSIDGNITGTKYVTLGSTSGLILAQDKSIIGEQVSIGRAQFGGESMVTPTRDSNITLNTGSKIAATETAHIAFATTLTTGTGSEISGKDVYFYTLFNDGDATATINGNILANRSSYNQIQFFAYGNAANTTININGSISADRIGFYAKNIALTSGTATRPTVFGNTGITFYDQLTTLSMESYALAAGLGIVFNNVRDNIGITVTGTEPHVIAPSIKFAGLDIDSDSEFTWSKTAGSSDITRTAPTITTPDPLPNPVDGKGAGLVKAEKCETTINNLKQAISTSANVVESQKNTAQAASSAAAGFATQAEGAASKTAAQGFADQAQSEKNKVTVAKDAAYTALQSAQTRLTTMERELETLKAIITDNAQVGTYSEAELEIIRGTIIPRAELAVTAAQQAVATAQTNYTAASSAATAAAGAVTRAQAAVAKFDTPNPDPKPEPKPEQESKTLTQEERQEILREKAAQAALEKQQQQQPEETHFERMQRESKEKDLAAAEKYAQEVKEHYAGEFDRQETALVESKERLQELISFSEQKNYTQQRADSYTTEFMHTIEIYKDMLSIPGLLTDMLSNVLSIANVASMSKAEIMNLLEDNLKALGVPFSKATLEETALSIYTNNLKGLPLADLALGAASLLSGAVEEFVMNKTKTAVESFYKLSEKLHTQSLKTADIQMVVSNDTGGTFENDITYTSGSIVIKPEIAKGMSFSTFLEKYDAVMGVISDMNGNFETHIGNKMVTVQEMQQQVGQSLFSSWFSANQESMPKEVSTGGFLGVGAKTIIVYPDGFNKLMQ